jgi:hypothetical protein
LKRNIGLRNQLLSLSNRGIKSCRELKNLESSINYDARGDSSGWGFYLGCNSDRVRKFLWVEVAGLFSWWNPPWGFGGVFYFF